MLQRGDLQALCQCGDKARYINSDVTLYLHACRDAMDRFDVVNHHASDGIAIGECWLYDEKARSAPDRCGAAQRKPMTNVPPP